MCFRIPPFGAPGIRAVKKETKLYLWDWSQVPGRGERIENLVACHLLKYCNFLEDTEGHRMSFLGPRVPASMPHGTSGDGVTAWRKSFLERPSAVR